MGRMIGAGSFGVVHVATEKATGQQYAVKSISKRFLGTHLEPHFVARIQHEVDVYRHMGQSLNVAHLVEAYEDDVMVDLVLELCTGGHLWSRIRQGAYSERAAALIIRDMLRAVAQCHAKGLVLRDVKPENFLFLDEREDAPLKMVDFGLADYCGEGQVLTERAGTPSYVAPEVLQQRYGQAADTWSAGITAYQLLSGRFPWEHDPDYQDDLAEQLERVSSRTRTRAAAESGLGGSSQVGASFKTLFRMVLYAHLDFETHPWDTISAEARGFVQSMLQRDPAQRPTPAELLRHPWLTSLDAVAPGAAAGTAAPLADTLVQRLQRYGTFGRLKQVALRRVASIMAADTAGLQEIAAAFRRLDAAGAGRIPYNEVLRVLQGYDLSNVEIRTLMSQFDLDQDGSIDYSEWAAALIDWQRLQSAPQWDAWMHKVFGLFDLNGSGAISVDELAVALCGSPAGSGGDDDNGGAADDLCSPDVVPAALREVDKDGDGEVSFEEFATLLRSSEADRLELFPARVRARAAAGSQAVAASAAAGAREAAGGGV